MLRFWSCVLEGVLRFLLCGLGGSALKFVMTKPKILPPNPIALLLNTPLWCFKPILGVLLMWCNRVSVETLGWLCWNSWIIEFQEFRLNLPRVLSESSPNFRWTIQVFQLTINVIHQNYPSDSTESSEFFSWVIKEVWLNHPYSVSRIMQKFQLNHPSVSTKSSKSFSGII